MIYRSEIDGLRALAVVPVLLFHAGLAGFGGGFVGVDVFFVISGFLITSILVSDLREGRFSLLRFYDRRARRILPALIFVALVCVPAAWLIMLPEPLLAFGRSLIAVATFTSNIYFWQDSGYFSAASELKPMLHTWSLAVEEQFYILYPLLLAAIWRYGLRSVSAVVLILALMSFAVAAWAVTAKPSAAFYLLPTRGWELLLGALGALWVEKRGGPASGPLAQVLSVAGLAAILFAVVAFDKGTPFPGPAALVPTIGTLLVLCCAGPATLARSVLSLRPFVAIGLISYSLYLWHQPLLAFLRHAYLVDVGIGPRLVAVGLSVPLAILTYRFIEQPARRGRFRIGHVLGSAVGGLAIAGLIGVVLSRPAIYENSPRQARFAVLDYEIDRERLSRGHWIALRERTGDPGYSVEDNPADLTDWFDGSDPRPRLLIVGNSHSTDVYNTLSLSASGSTAFQIARFGSQIAGLDDEFFSSPNYRAADVVMVATRYNAPDLAAIDRLAAQLVADGKLAVFVGNVFEFSDGVILSKADPMIIDCLRTAACDFADLADRSDREFYREFTEGAERNNYGNVSRALARLEARYPGIIVLDRMEYICPAETRRCHSLDARLNKYFFDYGHNTYAGAQALAGEVDRLDWLAPVISAAARLPPRALLD